MARYVSSLALACLIALSVPPVQAQDSPAAKATRKRLGDEKIHINIKDTGTKAFFDEVNLEFSKPFRFKIDNVSGVSNNTKITYSGKDLTLEKILNDVCEKNSWGWYIISNPSNNKEDGAIMLRKHPDGKKERGYEAGKEPKGK